MPFATLADQHCYYRFDGADAAPVLIFSHSLGLDHANVGRAGRRSAAAPAGASLRHPRPWGLERAVPASYDVASPSRTTCFALADALQIDRFAFCGLSLGGMIGQWLGVHAADRVTHLVLANTSPRPDADLMEQRRRAVLDQGIATIGDVAMARFFSPEPLRNESATGRLGSADAAGDDRHRDMPAAVRPSATGTDVTRCATFGPVHADHRRRSRCADALGRAQRDPRPRHRRCPRRPPSGRAYLQYRTAALLQRRARGVSSCRPADPDVAGLTIRRFVLGDAHVDRAIAATTDFTRDFQQMITRYAWGTVWTRPGLDLRTSAAARRRDDRRARALGGISTARARRAGERAGAVGLEGGRCCRWRFTRACPPRTPPFTSRAKRCRRGAAPSRAFRSLPAHPPCASIWC